MCQQRQMLVVADAATMDHTEKMNQCNNDKLGRQEGAPRLNTASWPSMSAPYAVILATPEFPTTAQERNLWPSYASASSFGRISRISGGILSEHHHSGALGEYVRSITGGPWWLFRSAKTCGCSRAW